MKASSATQDIKTIDRWLPVLFFAGFFLAISLATLIYAPSWGLMDDWGLLKVARGFWGPPINWYAMTENYIVNGMLRPFYYTWAAIFYGVFRDWPAGFYVFIAACNMLAMIFWGFVLNKVFAVRREDRFWTIFFYPLTFFLFTPYWNIFNYLSLQEKFVVFFAPLAIIFYYRLYEKFSWRDCVGLLLCIASGLMSKATFIYVPAVLFLYTVLDLTIFRSRVKRSWPFFWISGAVLIGYVLFTLLFQIQGKYTEKYKSGLTGLAFLGKLFSLPLVIKCLMFIAVVGFLGVIGYVILKKKHEYSMAIVIYAGLIAYIVLLMPWGFHSYLLSAIGPLAMCAMFPVYAWLIRINHSMKWIIHALLAAMLIAVFIGNIMPNIERMADIGRAITFIKNNSEASEDIYFMPPGYEESALSTRKFTQKNVYYCSDAELTAQLLTDSGRNYLILTNFFASLKLKGVEVGDRVYSNSTWQIFEIKPGDPSSEKVFKVEFRKSLIHHLKVMIREL